MKRARDRAGQLANGAGGALRAAADAALQLALPLFGHTDGHATPLLPPPTAAPGQRRHAMFGQRVIEYELRRSRRRSIGFLIDSGGLRITAPRHTPLAEVDAALSEKADWVLRKLDEWRTYVERRERSAIRWTFGERIPYLGGHLVLEPADEPAGAARRKPCAVAYFSGQGVGDSVGDSVGDGLGDGLIVDGATSARDNALRIWLPPGAPADAVRDAAQDWLKARARDVFAERMPTYTARLGREPSRWGLSSARTRWGSCAPDGSIRLNWRLIHFPLAIVDYVIAHELAHLVHLNHGPRFWAKVESLMPDYREARQMLREYPDDMLTH
jgi:predicted metal-dependent hydrolase